MQPTKIEVDNNTLTITWSDKSMSGIETLKLRKHCPCAVCTSQPDGSDEMKVRRFTEDKIKISSVSVVGNYALNIIWQDGHNTGIYEFQVLKYLSLN